VDGDIWIWSAGRGLKPKDKGHSITGHQGPRGRVEGIALLIFNLGAKKGVGG
jgi:hypothetical protein